MEKREVTKIRGDWPLEQYAWQHKSSDALPTPAARDTNPVAEGCAARPVPPKNAKRIGELGFEG